MATLGKVFTNTRKGVSAREMPCDHAIAMPRATPATPASTKAPRISTPVIQLCASQGISSLSMACHTA